MISAGPCETRSYLLLLTKGRIHAHPRNSGLKHEESDWKNDWYKQDLVSVYDNLMWVFPKIGVPQMGWFIMENLIKLMIWGEKPLFSETPPCDLPGRWMALNLSVKAWHLSAVPSMTPTLRLLFNLEIRRFFFANEPCKLEESYCWSPRNTSCRLSYCSMYESTGPVVIGRGAKVWRGIFSTSFKK